MNSASPRRFLVGSGEIPNFGQAPTLGLPSLLDGWYRGRIGFHGGIWDNYGADLGLLTQLEVTTTDGATRIVLLDSLWRSSAGPVVAASLT